MSIPNSRVRENELPLDLPFGWGPQQSSGQERFLSAGRSGRRWNRRFIKRIHLDADLGKNEIQVRSAAWGQNYGVILDCMLKSPWEY